MIELLKMSEPLQSSNDSLERAKHLVTEFEGYSKAFFSTNPFERVMEFDPDTNEDVDKVKLVKPMPKQINGIANDAIANIRSALDQACYAVAIRSGKLGKHCTFPFGDNLAQASSRIMGNSREIPKTIFDVMMTFRPYQGGDDLLWSLNKINNSNKHNLINPMAICSMGTQWHGSLIVVGPAKMMLPVWNSEKNEAELSRVSKGSVFKFDGSLSITMAMAFGNVPVLKGQEFCSIINILIQKVEDILVSIDAEAKKLGLFGL